MRCAACDQMLFSWCKMTLYVYRSMHAIWCDALHVKELQKMRCVFSRHFQRVWVLDLGYEVRTIEKSIENPHFISCFVFKSFVWDHKNWRCMFTDRCMRSDANHAMCCMRSDAIFFVRNGVVCLQIDACDLMQCGAWVRCYFLCTKWRCVFTDRCMRSDARFLVQNTFYVYRSMHATWCGAVHAIWCYFLGKKWRCMVYRSMHAIWCGAMHGVRCSVLHAIWCYFLSMSLPEALFKG